MRKKQANTPGAAKHLLEDPSACALPLVKALELLFKEEWRDWEPETLWLSLERMGLHVPAENCVKISAALALHLMPSFYWDGIVFEKTALAFAGHVPNPQILEEANSAQLSWAVIEAAQLLSHFGDKPRDFDTEPKAYAAVVMHREGLVATPDELKFARPMLDVHDKELQEHVEKAWAAMPDKDLAAQAFPEDAVSVQLAKLAAVRLYVQDHTNRSAAQLSTLL